MLSRGRIPVHPLHLSIGEQGMNLLFQTFCSNADTPEPMAPAFGAVSGRLDLVIAIMALKRTVLEMMGEGDAAIRALKCEPAVGTEDEV